VESLEYQQQVFHPSHRSWKSLRDSHISTASTAAYIYKGRIPTPSSKNQQLRVGQNKLPNWTKFACQTQSSAKTTDYSTSLNSLLNEHDVSRITGLSLASVRRWRLLRQGPKFLKIGAAVRYKQDDLAAWIEARPTGGEQAEAQ